MCWSQTWVLCGMGALNHGSISLASLSFYEGMVVPQKHEGCELEERVPGTDKA